MKTIEVSRNSLRVRLANMGGLMHTTTTSCELNTRMFVAIILIATLLSLVSLFLYATGAIELLIWLFHMCVNHTYIRPGDGVYTFAFVCMGMVCAYGLMVIVVVGARMIDAPRKPSKLKSLFAELREKTCYHVKIK